MSLRTSKEVVFPFFLFQFFLSLLLCYHPCLVCPFWFLEGPQGCLGWGWEIYSTSEEPKGHRVDFGRGEGGGTKKRGGRGQKGEGKIDSRKERWDEVGCQEESWMMPECIQLLNLHLNCCFICCGPALCSAGFPARSWDWFNEEVQRWLDLLMAWGPGVWAASTSQRFPLREARIS